jgi:hypothetical protein
VIRRAPGAHAALGCLALFAGCAFADGAAPDEDQVAASPSAPTTGPLDALSRRFGRIRSALRARGYAEVRALPRTFVVEGAGVAVPLDLPTGRCSTVAALGAGGLRELGLLLYDGAGNEVAVDGVAGEGALVHVCPQGPHPTAPHHLVLEAREGTGAVVSAIFDSLPGAGEGFEGLFEGVVAPSVPFRDVEERLAQARTVLRERGLVPLGDPRLELVAEGEALREPMELEGQRCYVVVARGGGGVEDLDLYLYDPAGAEVARNLESDAEPSLTHCPEQSGRHLFEVRAFEGAGAVGLMVAVGPPEAAVIDEVDKGAGDPGPMEEDGAGEDDPGPVVGGVTAALRERAYEPILVLREVMLMPGEVRGHELLVGPGCHVVVGAAARPGMDLDLYLTDADGAAVDQDARIEAAARVSACPEKPTLFRIKVKAYGREAPYVLTVMKAPPHVETVRDLRLDEADATLRARGYTRTREMTLTLARGERFTRTLQLTANQCIAVAAAGDRAVHDLDIFLRDEDERLVASESGPTAWGAVSRCAPHDEQLTLEVLMYRGAGEVVLAWLERDEEAPQGGGGSAAP